MKLPTKRQILPALIAFGLACWGGVKVWEWYRLRQGRIPERFAAQLPSNCQQVVLVLAAEKSGVQARLWLLERQGGGSWKARHGPFPAVIGRNGLRWGVGEHLGEAPPEWTLKQEGDGCSPAGIFRIPQAFGYAATAEAAWLKIPFLHLTPSLFGVDDPKSQHYNKIVDTTETPKDWDSAEIMLRADGLYRWGAVIEHNPSGIPGGGSCIFLHLWSGPEKGTAGCTALDEENVRRVLGWLDPAKHPRWVQWVAE